MNLTFFIILKLIFKLIQPIFESFFVLLLNYKNSANYQKYNKLLSKK